MAVEAIKRAIRSGDLEALGEHRLQELNVDVDTGLGCDDFTPLHWACYYGKTEVLQHFLDIGADVNLRTKQGWNGGHVSSIKGYANCLKILCHNGTDLTALDARGYSYAHLAAAHGKRDVLQAILRSGIDISTMDKRYWTVCHHAAFHGRFEVLKFAANMEIDLSSSDKEGNTPAHLAASEGHLDCLDFLVKNDPELTPQDVVACRNNNGATPKDLATKFQRQECIDFLRSVEKEATINDDVSVEYPAHAAVESGDLAMLKKLVMSGTHGVNDQDKRGNTLAHKAAANGECLCLQWLIDQGADVSLKNNDGETPRSLAIRFAHVGCISILAANGYGVEFSEEECEDDEDGRQMLASAHEKLEELQKLLDTAKARFRQLGGKLPDDKESSRTSPKSDHKQQVVELQKKLEHERIRRETLESELDQMRKKLHQKVSRNKSTGTPSHSSSTTTEDDRERIRRLKRRLSKRKNTQGGAFIRIDHI